MQPRSDFTKAVYAEIAKVPAGSVISYSQLAVWCGHPGAARVVGQIAHFGDPLSPWHRLVDADGRLAHGYVPGGPTQQKQLLIAEGVRFSNDKVIMKEYQL